MQYARGNRSRGKILSFCGLAIISLAAFGLPGASRAQDGGKTENQVQSIAVTGKGAVPTVEIRTAKPVGYRYTAYDSYDPVRLVIDFPGMDVAGAKLPAQIDVPPVQEIKVGSFDLTSGTLGRVELLLSRETKYKISSTDDLFSVSFPESAGPKPEVKAAKTPAAPPQAAKTEAPAPAEKAGAAQVVEKVQVRAGEVLLTADGKIGRIQSFRLGTPPRLVVDIFGVKPGFTDRTYDLSKGFRQVRVGTYADKTRFVFDAPGKALPEHNVENQGASLLISWAAQAEEPAAEKPAPAPPEKIAAKAAPAESTVDKPAASPKQEKKAPSARGVTVEAVDFKVEGGQSVLSVVLSGPAEVVAPAREQATVRFGVKNADISQALRRTIDASSFPSAVRMITPYIVAARGGEQEVRFAAELKGEVPYALRQEGNRVIFTVENKGFAQPVPGSEKLPVPMPASAQPQVAANASKPAERNFEPVLAAAAPAEPALPAAASQTVTATGDERRFSGERISLVFDDANIRNILQLIGEVSNLNIIAGEEVKGTITLRLIDVPWDQALDLILETKGLGMLQEGNVVRILPKDQIRSMRQAELTAKKEERQLETVVTEVIPVSYSDLKNITAPTKELLTDRGKITEDARNKQLIVTDIPSVVAEIKNLVSILDTPERQVMIEARIVEASSNFSRELGVRWGLTYANDSGGPGDIDSISIGGGGSFLLSPPAAGAVSSASGLAAGISFGRVLIDSVTLDLRISALESSGNGKVVSTPRVTTLNGGKAMISQGTKIPYQTIGDDGKADTSFENAELKLEVQPVINPDNSVILDIRAANSSVGAVVPSGLGTAISIEEKKAETKVIVKDGETTVIGGIFVENERYGESGVPLLARIPILGHLFKSTNNSEERRELLVFITPRILQ